MSELIEIDKYPVRDVLNLLLKDKSTGRNIIFATDMYSGYGCGEGDQITAAVISGFSAFDIQPRVLKAHADQEHRTRKKAEVFTPTWLCNMMNNFCDEDWFGRKEVFSRTDAQDKSLQISRTEGTVAFPEGRTWKDYVDSRRLEITCGEAPYIVSQYDATTGETIPVRRRTGILDRKLRIVGENTATEKDWLKWAERAFQSVYGYELQGDSLLIARINLLLTFCDYLSERWGRRAELSELKTVANIISWNLWQMDGLSGTVPAFSDENVQILMCEEQMESPPVRCRIYNWRGKGSVEFGKHKEKNERGACMKFDYVIGNPPYQDNTLGENETFAPPVYNAFMDASYKISDKVELIHPARFLFNAGSTPKAWNQKMLSDTHFKVLYFEQDSSKIFANTDIKGGVAITYHDNTKEFGAVETFTPFPELNSIMKKVEHDKNFTSLSDIVFSAYSNKFTKKMHEEHPDVISIMSKGHAYDLKSNVFEKLTDIFLENKPDDDEVYCRFIGLIKNKRTFRYIKKYYVEETKNLEKYKVLMPAANGSGAIGEVLSTPLIGEPLIGGNREFY